MLSSIFSRSRLSIRFWRAVIRDFSPRESMSESEDVVGDDDDGMWSISSGSAEEGAEEG